MITVDEVKLALRQTSTVLDKEVQSVMLAAVLDLQSGGMPADMDNALTDEAIRLYCKWRYDYMGKAAQYERAYEKIKAVLAMLPAEG